MTDEKEDIVYSSPKRIIIVSKEQSYTFEKNTYKEEYLRHCISKLEYDRIVESASKIMGHSWAKKRMNDEIKLPKFVIILAAIAVLLTIVYMILLYLSVTSDNGTSLLISSIICVSVGSLIAFSLSVYNFCRKIGRFKSLEEIIKEDLDEYFGNINRNFVGRLEFVFNVNKRWIECNILKEADIADYKEVKRNFIYEEVGEELENDNEDDTKRNFHDAKHSRAQSHFSFPKKAVHSKNPSLNKVGASKHGRAQSTVVNKKGEDVFDFLS
jgi:hypothetical protein